MKIKNPDMLALLDQINASSKDDRDHLKMAVDEVIEITKPYGIHGAVALALVSCGTVFAVDWEKP